MGRDRATAAGDTAGGAAGGCGAAGAAGAACASTVIGLAVAAGGASGGGGDHEPSNSTLVGGIGLSWELFDLQADPDELHNIVGEPGARGLRCELMRELLRLKAEARDDDALYCTEMLQPQNQKWTSATITLGELCSP